MPVLLKKYYYVPYKDAGGIGFIRKKASDLSSWEASLVFEVELLDPRDDDYRTKLDLLVSKLPDKPQ